jgi:hypothetical protein
VNRPAYLYQVRGGQVRCSTDQPAQRHGGLASRPY